MAHASGFVNSSGIPNVVSTVTFEAPTFGLGTAITTQYFGQGVFFAPNVIYTSFSGFIGLTGFGVSDCLFVSGSCSYVDPFSIMFTAPRTAAAFAFSANNNSSPTTFTAFLNGCPVESFSHATQLPSGAQNPNAVFVGFTGIVFDEIRIFQANFGGFSALAVVDNIQLGPAATLTAGALNHSVHGHVNTGSPGHFAGIANHQHHGDHGHIATACPPHFGPHDFFTVDLTPAAGPEIVAASPNFVAALNQDNSPNGDPAPGAATIPARRGSVVQLYGSARGLYLDDADTQPVATESGGFTPPASGSPLYYTTSVPELRIGGLAARVQFSGLAPGLTATWQINFVVPEDAPGGKLPVNVFYEGRLLTSIDISVE